MRFVCTRRFVPPPFVSPSSLRLYRFLCFGNAERTQASLHIPSHTTQVNECTYYRSPKSVSHRTIILAAHPLTLIDWFFDLVSSNLCVAVCSGANETNRPCRMALTDKKDTHTKTHTANRHRNVSIRSSQTATMQPVGRRSHEWVYA